MVHSRKRKLIEGQPVLVVIDIQGGESESNEPSAIPFMTDYQKQMDRAPALIEKARECDIPVVFIQEAHRRDLVDFGRELDGVEDIHLLEGEPGTEIAKAVGMRSDDYFIRKRRYSCFFWHRLRDIDEGVASRHADHDRRPYGCVRSLFICRRASARLLLPRR